MLRKNHALRRAEVVDDRHAASVTIERRDCLWNVELYLRRHLELFAYAIDVSERRLQHADHLVEVGFHLVESWITILQIETSSCDSYA